MIRIPATTFKGSPLWFFSQAVPPGRRRERDLLRQVRAAPPPCGGGGGGTTAARRGAADGVRAGGRGRRRSADGGRLLGPGRGQRRRQGRGSQVGKKVSFYLYSNIIPTSSVFCLAGTWPKLSMTCGRCEGDPSTFPSHIFTTFLKKETLFV